MSDRLSEYFRFIDAGGKTEDQWKRFKKDKRYRRRAIKTGEIE